MTLDMLVLKNDVEYEYIFMFSQTNPTQQALITYAEHVV